MDCFDSLAMTEEYAVATHTARLREPPRTRKIFFIIFVDAIFTTLFEPLFTNVFEVIARNSAISCLYLARTTD
jgi:hypothetical protein